MDSSNHTTNTRSDREREGVTHMEETKGPAYKVRYGSVSGTVWTRTATKGNQTFDVEDVNIENNYLDKDGQWQSNSKFNKNDLQNVELAARDCYVWILEHRRKKRAEQKANQ